MDNDPNIYETPNPESSSIEAEPQLPKRSRKGLWAALIIVALLVAAILVYVIFFRSPDTGPGLEGEVTLNLVAPNENVSGADLSYELTINNGLNARIGNITLELFYPNGFLVVDSTPISSDNERLFALPDLISGETFTLTINGQLQGSVQQLKRISAKVRYQPANFSSQFETEAVANTEILAPKLLLEIDTPDQVIAGQTAQYSISVTNQSDEIYDEVIVRADYPDGFNFVSSSPVPVRNRENEWRLRNFSPEDQTLIAIQGALTGDEGPDRLFRVELFVADESDNLFSLGRNFAFIEVEAPPFVLTHEVTSKLEDGGVFLAGQDIVYAVTYTHRGRTGLQNVVINVEFPPEVLDVSEFKSESGQLQGNLVKFIPATSPELLVVEPNQSGRFEFKFKARNNLGAGGQSNLFVKTTTFYTAEELTDPAFGNELSVKVQTKLDLNASMVIISGANPPKEGELTQYEVELRVVNGVNVVDSAELSLIIPNLNTDFLAETLTPVSEQAAVQFIPLARVLRWQLGEVPAFSGSLRPARSIKFQVNSTSRKDVLQNIVVTGIDRFTQNQVSSSEIRNLAPNR